MVNKNSRASISILDVLLTLTLLHHLPVITIWEKECLIVRR